MLKENGVPGPYEMHQVSLKKHKEIFGADAVLYVTIEEWGTQYLVLGSKTSVRITYKLIDTQSGATIWQMDQRVEDSSGGSGNLTAALVSAAVHALSSAMSEKERDLAIQANAFAFNGHRRLLKGPYHPDHQKDRTEKQP
jgi:hypothetical protein